jgi:hypothetical protein
MTSNQARPKLAQQIVNPVPAMTIANGVRRFHMRFANCNRRAAARGARDRGRPRRSRQSDTATARPV